MSNTIPLPEPELFYWKPSFVKGESVQIKGYTAEAMHAHAAAVSAAKDAEIAQLRQYLDAAQRRAAALGGEVAGLRKLMLAVAIKLDDNAPNGPGHPHEKPGVWDESNKSDIAGKPCEWCALWTAFNLAARKGEA